MPPLSPTPGAESWATRRIIISWSVFGDGQSDGTIRGPCKIPCWANVHDSYLVTEANFSPPADGQAHVHFQGCGGVHQCCTGYKCKSAQVPTYTPGKSLDTSRSVHCPFYISQRSQKESDMLGRGRALVPC